MEPDHADAGGARPGEDERKREGSGGVVPSRADLRMTTGGTERMTGTITAAVRNTLSHDAVLGAKRKEATRTKYDVSWLSLQHGLL
jgi:hypothetical protein